MKRLLGGKTEKTLQGAAENGMKGRDDRSVFGSI
jgi:hypothetical protein